MKECKNSECRIQFSPNTHNQIYCTAECTRVATNNRIMARYYADRARLRGEKRMCECGAKLSRYNKTNICQACLSSSSEQQQRYIDSLSEFIL